MNRFEKITKDIDSFVEWVHEKAVSIEDDCNYGFPIAIRCKFCFRNKCDSYKSCEEGIKEYFEEEINE